MTSSAASLDHQILAAVRTRFEFTTDLDASQVAIGIRGSVITLSGEVSTHAQVHRATAAAQEIAGVSSVANDITVRTPWRSAVADSDIAAAVVGAIAAAAVISPDRIKVEVTRRVVTLRGEVDWNVQREEVDVAVRAIPGVDRVADLLTVKHN